MSRLFATIDWSSNTVQFSGPGTFEHKDEIKRLGVAVWRGEKKVWEVRFDGEILEELGNRFPGVVIDEVGEPRAAVSVPTASTGISAQTSSSGVNPAIPAGISVSEVISRSRAAVKSAFPGTVFVYGVLSQVKQRDNGSVFMELAELEKPDERLSCIIWSHADTMCRKLHEAGFKLEAQLQVMFEAEVNLSNKDGRLSLRVTRIIAEYTLAKLAALRDQTNERLKSEGLFAKNKLHSLCFLPRKLGIITSSGGTVIHDFRASLDEAKFGFELFWVPVQVQGNEAKKSLLRAIQYFSKQSDLDAVLIFRGGGSQADLAVFNDYDVARAVCLCPLPVISAIGHQEDQSSVQDVSWRGLGVPKDIGRFFADIIIQYRERMTNFASTVLRLGSAKLEQWTQAVSRSPIPALAAQVLNHRSSQLLAASQRIGDGQQRLLENKNVRFSALGEGFLRGMMHLHERTEIRLEGLEHLIEAASPETQMKRGFAMVRERASGKFILDGQKVPAGEHIIISFRDGERKGKLEHE